MIRTVMPDRILPYIFGNLINTSVENIPVLIKNQNNLLPLKPKFNNIINLQFGNDKGSVFKNYLNKYMDITSVKTQDIDENELNDIVDNYETIIVSLHMKSNTPWENMNKKFSSTDLEMLKIINKHNKKILVSFTNPYMLNQLNLNSYNSILVGFQNNQEFQKTIAQQIYGAKSVQGILPVTINESFREGDGIILDNINILSYGDPKSVGVDVIKL